MRFGTCLTLIALFLAGCVSSATPHNPMGNGVSAVDSSQPWWQASTVGVSNEDNPWEAFNQPTAKLEIEVVKPAVKYETGEMRMERRILEKRVQELERQSSLRNLGELRRFLEEPDETPSFPHRRHLEDI